MRKTWIGSGVRIVVEYTLGLFAGLETFEGWILGKPVAWLAAFAGWPLYTAMTFFAVGMCALGTIHLAGVWRESEDRDRRKRARGAITERETLARIVEGMIELYNATHLDDMERLSFFEISRDELARFDLAAPDDYSDNRAVLYYRRLLPYLRHDLKRAQEAARSWRKQKGDADG